ncbi:glycosyltransferase [Brevundimonas naejangsanensis]
MVQGKIESFSKGILTGWIWEPGALAARVSFELLVNDVVVGRYVADSYRADLAEKGIGDGKHGFAITVSDDIVSRGSSVFSIKVDGEASETVKSFVVDKRFRGALKRFKNTFLPAISQASEDESARLDKPSRKIKGRIERYKDGKLHGWLKDENSPDPVGFLLYADDKPVGRFRADILRQDLVRASIGLGYHAFRIEVLPEWLTSEETSFSIKILPEHFKIDDTISIARPINSHIAVNKSPTAQTPTVDLIPRPRSVKELSAVINDWPLEKLFALQDSIARQAILARARQLFSQKKWSELASLKSMANVDNKSKAEINLLVGRALLYSGDPSSAASLLAATAIVLDNQAAPNFYAAVANAKLEQYERAVHFGRLALAIDPTRKQYLVDQATYLRRYAVKFEGSVDVKQALLQESIQLFRLALKVDDSREDYCLYTIARNELDLELFDDVVETIEQLVQRFPDHIDGLMLQSHALVALNRVEDALIVAEKVVELDPLRQAPRFQLRTLRTLVEGPKPSVGTFGALEIDDLNGRYVVYLIKVSRKKCRFIESAVFESEADLARFFASLRIDWLLLTERDPSELNLDASWVVKSSTSAPAWSGCIVNASDQLGVKFWRTDLIVGLTESGLIKAMPDVARVLDQVSEQVATYVVGKSGLLKTDLMSRVPTKHDGTVIVGSRHGIVKFGGGEHFLDSMAEHYESLGYQTITIGVQRERVGQSGVEAGRHYAFVGRTPAELRAFILDVKPRFVHILSGLGYELSEALEYLSIPLVYGVHFWRDCLGSSENDTRYFLSHDQDPVPKPAFKYIIENAAVVYANSEYTRNILNQAFHFRPPVIYSLPRDVKDSCLVDSGEAEDLVGDWSDYILLVNAKSNKGFDLILEAARRVPFAKFLVIASQSDTADAVAAVDHANVSNVKIIGHTSRMDILYRQAKAVAVPSYMFVETFSRVCIEAQRYGKPVLGATIGNIPFLLKESGIVLPNDAHAWAAEISRIFTDNDYYVECCRRAVENSEKYSYSLQQEAVTGVINSLTAPILVGVGSGIGNMLHVGPMIANISRRLGRKIDLVLTEDHEESLFLLQNTTYVNSVFSLRQEVLRRRYETVFITHSFGNVKVPFHADRVLYARDWMGFEPGGDMHETIYNLECAKELLGIPYEQDDVGEYYVADYKYVGPFASNKIGIHGGSKDGFWTSKRWPYFQELSGRLQKLGYEVYSLGIAEEYIEGTIDWTGGSINEMVEKMLDLSYFVSNDSGVMNIANSLGIPLMGLFGPTNPATRGPIGTKSRWMAINKDCSPCEVTKAGRAKFQAGQCMCIADLGIDDVEAAIIRHINEVGYVGLRDPLKHLQQ